ncbi:MAG: VOC family protein [Legionella sp.]|uniref:VOC family protein n=1 Tax=Legionella sp. TaxID=459 RepID=UPI0039E31F60
MNLPSKGQFCWNELATNDVQRAKEFYSKLLDWEFKEIKSDDMTYTLIRSGNKECGGIWQIPNDQKANIPPHWMAYILVDNVQKTLEQAKKHGATEVKGVTQAGDMGHLAIIMDPTGAHIAFWEPNR